MKILNRSTVQEFIIVSSLIQSYSQDLRPSFWFSFRHTSADNNDSTHTENQKGSHVLGLRLYLSRMSFSNLQNFHKWKLSFRYVKINVYSNVGVGVKSDLASCRWGYIIGFQPIKRQVAIVNSQWTLLGFQIWCRESSCCLDLDSFYDTVDLEYDLRSMITPRVKIISGNPLITNFVDIPGALSWLRLQYEYS